MRAAALSLDTESIQHRTSRPQHRRPGGNRLPRDGRDARAAKWIKATLGRVKARRESNRTTRSAVEKALSLPLSLQRAYLRLLAPAHQLLRDRHIEKLLFRPTPQIGGLSETDGRQTIYDGPIPGGVLDWVIADLDVTLRECAFVDFRAGNGRTLLYAAMHDFERVIGYEYNQPAQEDAQLNISQFPRTLMNCRDVECRRGDQADINLPGQPLVLYFPNAAHERFMSLLLDHVSASYRSNPRRMFIIMENAGDMADFGHEDIFYEVKLPLATSLRLKLFSPVDIRVYRSIA